MRTLLIRPGALGDFVVSLPALEFLRTEYTEVWCSEENRSLAWFANKTKAIAGSGFDLLGLDGLLPPDGLLKELSTFDQLVSWKSTLPATCIRDKRGGSIRSYRPLPPPDWPKHAVDFYLEQVGAPTGAMPRIPVPESPREGIAIHPFSGSSKKNWPLERFLAVAERLGKTTFFRGFEEILPAAEYHESRWELAQRLSQFRLFIGNDSGVSHLAAAVGTPVIALFGPTNPTIWAPRGPNVQIIHKPQLTDISVDEVVHAAVTMAALG